MIDLPFKDKGCELSADELRAVVGDETIRDSMAAEMLAGLEFGTHLATGHDFLDVSAHAGPENNVFGFSQAVLNPHVA